MTILPKPIKQPVTREDLQLKTPGARLPTALVLDGRLEAKNLAGIGRSEAWLRQELKKHGVADLKSVLIAMLDTEGRLFYQQRRAPDRAGSKVSASSQGRRAMRLFICVVILTIVFLGLGWYSEILIAEQAERILSELEKLASAVFDGKTAEINQQLERINQLWLTGGGSGFYSSTTMTWTILSSILPAPNLTWPIMPMYSPWRDRRNETDH